MDKLSKALREDAEKIRVEVSPELEKRIQSSLQGIDPLAADTTHARRPLISIGWASGLTGIGIAALLIFVVNIDRSRSPGTVLPPLESASDTMLLLNAERAVFTAPLTEELDNLESDLKKVEQAVKREIGLGL